MNGLVKTTLLIAGSAIAAVAADRMGAFDKLPVVGRKSKSNNSETNSASDLIKSKTEAAAGEVKIDFDPVK